MLFCRYAKLGKSGKCKLPHLKSLVVLSKYFCEMFIKWISPSFFVQNFNNIGDLAVLSPWKIKLHYIFERLAVILRRVQSNTQLIHGSCSRSEELYNIFIIKTQTIMLVTYTINLERLVTANSRPALLPPQLLPRQQTAWLTVSIMTRFQDGHPSKRQTALNAA